MTAPNASDWAEIVDLRALLHHQGWRVIPVCERTKAPVFSRWPDYRYDPSDPEPIVPRTCNAQGEPSREALIAASHRLCRPCDPAALARLAFLPEAIGRAVG